MPEQGGQQIPAVLPGDRTVHLRIELGCTRPAWDREGACSFHHLVCWGLIEE